MENFVLIQVLGIITLILFVISMQLRKKESFLMLQTIGTVLFVIQYILTGKITGAVLFTIAVVRGLVYFYYKKKNLKPSVIVLIIFQAAVFIGAFLTWQNFLSIIPLISSAARTWGTWQDDMKWARRTSLLGQTCMIIYNLTGSPPMLTGALTEFCNCTSSLIAIWRYDIKKEKKKQNI